MPIEAKVRGYEKLPNNDYDSIMYHLNNNGPLGINVSVDDGFTTYQEGVYNGCSTDKIQINHGVTLEGYGTDETYGDYWLIRNHWGANWGENGYIRLKREKNPACGWNNAVREGTTCLRDGVDDQWVCGMCGVLFEAVYPINVE